MIKLFSIPIAALLATGCATSTQPQSLPTDHPASIDAPAAAMPASSDTLAHPDPLAPAKGSASGNAGMGGMDMGSMHDMKGMNMGGSSSSTTAPAEQYTCMMHPEVISDKPGKCPKCGMKLVKKHRTAGREALMVLTKALLFTSLSGVTLLGGCAAVQPRESFSEVERTVAESTNYRVHWNTGGDADKAVAAQVTALLAKPLDADAAVQVALLNNRKLQATYEEMGVAQADLVAAGLFNNPVFNGSARFGQSGGPTIDLDIAFNFLDVFFIGLRKDLAAAQLESVKVNVTSAVLGTVGDVKVAFYNLQAAQQVVELDQQVVQATAASYDLAKRMREAGNNRALDLAYERALHEESRLALAAAENEAVLAREQLGRLMGIWGASNTWTVGGRLADLSPDETRPSDLEKTAIKNSLALRASRAQITVALRELGITKPLGYLSDLEVGASAERDTGDWEAGPSVALPIPIFSQGQPAVARVQARLRQAEQQYYATAVDVRSSIRSSYARVQSLRQRAEYYRTVILPLRQSIVDESQLQYNAMQIGAFQLLEAKRDQVAAATTYLSLLREFWTGQTGLKLGLSGGMTDFSSNDSSGMNQGMTSTSSTSAGH